MPKKRFLQARPFLALGLLAAVWTVLPVGVKALTRISFAEFNAPAEIAASYARDLQDFWGKRLHSESDLIEAGIEMGRVNARYEQVLRDNEALRDEVARLERLLSLPARETYRYEVARVVRRDFSVWWQQIVIRKGRNYGIRVGAPVVFSGGVVGRVREVGNFESVVDLLSSRQIRLAANFEGDNRPLSFRGGPNPAFAAPRGIVEYVPADLEATPNHPLLLVTSGLGGVFPPGLPLGRVERLHLGPDGQFKVGEVLLDPRLGALTEVAVLIPRSPEGSH